MTIPAATETLPLDMGQDGVIRVSQTRVTLDTLVQAFTEGATAEEIAQQYPSVPLADVYSVIGYYLRQGQDIEAYLSRRQEQALLVRRQIEERNNPVGIRERLLARRASRGA
jgi:uncharacterized protein (DUF433 family)